MGRRQSLHKSTGPYVYQRAAAKLVFVFFIFLKARCTQINILNSQHRQ